MSPITTTMNISLIKRHEIRIIGNCISVYSIVESKFLRRTKKRHLLLSKNGSKKPSYYFATETTCYGTCTCTYAYLCICTCCVDNYLHRAYSVDEISDIAISAILQSTLN